MEKLVSLSFLTFSECFSQWEVLYKDNKLKIKEVGVDSNNKADGVINLLAINHLIGINQVTMEIKDIGEVNKVDLEIKVLDQDLVTEKSYLILLVFKFYPLLQRVLKADKYLKRV